MAFVATPGDAALLARMFAWRLCLPVLKYVLPLPRLVRLMSSRPRRGGLRRPRERRIATMAAWLYRRGGILATDDNCLERSLLAYRYLAREGSAPTLVVGMRPDSDANPRGHVWVTVSGRSVTDTETSLDAFRTVVSFGADGVRAADDDRTHDGRRPGSFVGAG